MRDAIFWIEEVPRNVRWVRFFGLRIAMYFGHPVFRQKYFDHMQFESGRFVEAKCRIPTLSRRRLEINPS